MNIYARWFDETIYEEHLNVNCMGGGGVSTPPPSEEEKALQTQQAESLAKQTELLEKQMAEQEAFKPYVLAQMGYKIGEGGGIVKMTEEERLARMAPYERSQEELAQQYQKGMLEQMPLQTELSEMALERQRKALAGELDVSPALESELASQEEGLAEMLSRRLGSGWRETTPGIQSMAELKSKSELLREESRRGEIQGGQGLMLAQLDRLTNQARWGEQQGQSRLSNLVNLPNRGMSMHQGFGMLQQGYGTAMQPYQSYRDLQTSASMQTAANKAARRQGYVTAGSAAAAAAAA